jgi:hypothetical protein
MGTSESKTYSGGCHCGRVRYEVTTDLAKVISCNCSICSKRAPLLTFVAPEQFKVLSGEPSSLTDYQFNRKVIHHLFCPTCGIESYATGATPDGSRMFAVNVRCLDGVDISSLQLTSFDGKRL